jgi:transcriptional regulator with XRE-family HTH domain
MATERNPNEVALGAALRAIREGAGMSRRSLAKAASIDHTHLSRVEAGERVISPELLHKVLSALADRLLHRGEAA